MFIYNGLVERTVQEEGQFDGYAPNALLSPTTSSRLSPLFDGATAFQITSPMMQMPSPLSQIPSPPQLFTPPPSPAPVWSSRQMQMPTLSSPPQAPPHTPQTPQTPQSSPQQIVPHMIQHPIQPVHTIPLGTHTPAPVQQNIPQQHVQQPTFEQDIKPQLRQAFDSAQMLSLLLEEKRIPFLLSPIPFSLFLLSTVIVLRSLFTPCFLFTIPYFRVYVQFPISESTYNSYFRFPISESIFMFYFRSPHLYYSSLIVSSSNRVVERMARGSSTAWIVRGGTVAGDELLRSHSFQEAPHSPTLRSSTAYECYAVVPCMLSSLIPHSFPHLPHNTLSARE